MVAVALGHGLNPFISHVVWAPYGADVLWTTTVPVISLLAAPVTLALGPTIAWNLLCVIAPALSAWAAYLLCRELTGRLWPSALGGPCSASPAISSPRGSPTCS